jgi:hypothetical protein
VTAHLALTNDRPVEVAFIEPCGSGTMTVTLPVPLEPTGETWSGVKRAFKEYSLKSSQGSPMESSIRGPLPTYAQAGSCDASAPEGSAAGAVLAPGATYEADLMWTAELVRDLPATAGSMPFTVMVEHDVEAAGNGLTQYDTLEADGSITVLPGGRPSVSAGQALDVALGDTRFAKWLAKHPRKTWVNTNLFLQPGAIGVKSLPSVPYWDVELFAEPRSWAFLTVDAAAGTVLTRMFCNVPCDR